MSRRTTLPPPRLRKRLPPLAAPGRCPTLAARPRIRVRGGRRMISGIRFRWSIMIMPPPSLNNSLNHSRPTASLHKKSNNRSTQSRHRRRGRTGQGGSLKRGTTRHQRSLPHKPPLPLPHPPLATSQRSKLCHPHLRTTLHVPELHPEGTRRPQIQRTSPPLKSPRHFRQRLPSPRQMG